MPRPRHGGSPSTCPRWTCSLAGFSPTSLAMSFPLRRGCRDVDAGRGDVRLDGAVADAGAGGGEVGEFVLVVDVEGGLQRVGHRAGVRVVRRRRHLRVRVQHQQQPPLRRRARVVLQPHPGTGRPGRTAVRRRARGHRTGHRTGHRSGPALRTCGVRRARPERQPAPGALLAAAGPAVRPGGAGLAGVGEPGRGRGHRVAVRAARPGRLRRLRGAAAPGAGRRVRRADDPRAGGGRRPRPGRRGAARGPRLQGPAERLLHRLRRRHRRATGPRGVRSRRVGDGYL
ncbi:hypothetical protein SHIRM173S_06065 [Streptomyces hirsutus]